MTTIHAHLDIVRHVFDRQFTLLEFKCADKFVGKPLQPGFQQQAFGPTRVPARQLQDIVDDMTDPTGMCLDYFGEPYVLLGQLP